MKKYFDLHRFLFVMMAMFVAMGFVSCGGNDDDQATVGGVGTGNIKWLDKTLDISYGIYGFQSGGGYLPAGWGLYAIVLSNKAFEMYSVKGYKLTGPAKGASQIVISIAGPAIDGGILPTGNIPYLSDYEFGLLPQNQKVTHWQAADIEQNYLGMKFGDSESIYYLDGENGQAELSITNLGGNKYRVSLIGNGMYMYYYDYVYNEEEEYGDYQGKNSGTTSYEFVYEGELQRIEMPEGLGE